MKRNKAYKIRLYPTEDQIVQMNKTFGATRFIWNAVLSYRKDLYASRQTSYSKNESIKAITEIKQIDGYEWLSEVETVALQQVLIDQDVSYKNFFRKIKRGKKTCVNFKSKHNNQSYRTINVSNTIRVASKKIRLPKLKWIKFRYNKAIPETETIKSVTVSKSRTGKFHASILVEYEFTPNSPKQLNVSEIFAADMSCKNFMISEQMEFKNQKFYRRNERRLKIRQRDLSRKVKGSNRRVRYKLFVAQTHENIVNQRRGFWKNLVFELINKFDAFCFEDLNIDAMKRFNPGVSKTVSFDFSWTEFLTFLEWKCFDKNKHFVKISRWFPSSKMCSECGLIKEDLTLKDRTFKCECGFTIDRDVNAARNIKSVGIDDFTELGIEIYKFKE